jgi:DNA-binding SARP family transcriptional activator
MIACVHEQRFGKPDPRRLARLISECRELGAGVLEAWAQGYLALAATAEGLPDADVEARAAAMLAGAAGVPGVHVAATVARARLDPRRRAALLCEADALASAAGMPSGVVRLWAGPDRDTSAPAVVTQRTPPVSIRCFGGFRMAIGGHPVETAAVRARARAALRLLAMQAGQVVHREVIIDALWPGLPPAAATRNLQVTISTLRGLLEPGSGRGKAQLLVRTGDAYGIAVPLDGWADTLEFTAAVHRWNQVRHGGDRAAELAALRAAMAAYGGDLLPEDGPAEWVVEPRERLRRQATRVAGALAAAELADGDTSAAIAAAEYCVTSLDPHDDEAWQVLLRAYPASNSPARAADARRRYRQMLDSLGIATGVLAATPVRAADRVLSHARRPPPPRSPVDVRAPLRRPT